MKNWPNASSKSLSLQDLRMITPAFQELAKAVWGSIIRRMSYDVDNPYPTYDLFDSDAIIEQLKPIALKDAQAELLRFWIDQFQDWYVHGNYWAYWDLSSTVDIGVYHDLFRDFLIKEYLFYLFEKVKYLQRSQSSAAEVCTLTTGAKITAIIKSYWFQLDSSSETLLLIERLCRLRRQIMAKKNTRMQLWR